MLICEHMNADAWFSIAVCCSVVQRGAAWCSVLQCVAVWSSVVQCGLVWLSILQCVARTIQYVATYTCMNIHTV